jgi:hypothetical protein
LTLNIVKNIPYFSLPAILQARGAINLKTYLGVAPNCVLVRNLAPKSEYEGGVTFYQLSCTLEFNFDGWYESVLDAGFTGKALVRYSTTLATTYAPQVPYQWDTAPTTFKNRDSSPRSEATLLDGQGRELPPNDPAYPPVFLYYLPVERKQADLAALGLVWF